MILLFWFGVAFAIDCAGAADGTPCICAATIHAGCATVGFFNGVLSGGICNDGTQTCNDDGTISNNKFCCHGCGDSQVGALGTQVEDCDPPSRPDGCCDLNCKFVSSPITCNNPSDTEGDATCSQQDTCDGHGACTANSVASGTFCNNPSDVEGDATCSLQDTCNGHGACSANSAASGTTCTAGDSCTPDLCNGHGTCVAATGCSGGVADPHIFGPFGEKFEFHGQGGGVYTMFSSRQIVVNAQMMTEGPENHFMTKIAVAFGNVTLMFDTINRPANYLDKMNALLEPLGARATGNKYQTELHLCDGQIVEISQMHSGQYFFLNVDIDVAGCHDDFNGVIGQLYQCAYTAGTFVWDSANEELFRVPSLDSAAGSFDSSSSCYQRHEYGTAFPAKKK